ncbi:hypothetical protein IAT38_000762 [Cryptococcus sp. DSM 104549]
MGKAQYKKKTQEWRHNPVRVPDSHLGSGKGEGKADPAKEKQMLPILKKLKSTEYADRTWACAAICNLIQNDPATRRLFQSKNVVGELIERLTDDVDEVIVEASGALRNLAIDGGHELCGEMANKGIISHLIVLTGKISNTIDGILAGPSSENNTDANFQERKHLLALAENVISLMWSLAEASPKTLASVNALGSEGLLIKVLEGREQLGLGVSLAAAQTLFALSQDNQPFRKALILHPTARQTLVEVAQEDHLPTEANQVKPRKGKGKGKAGAEMEPESDLPDGRALLRRVLVCGVLRNIIRAGARADQEVGINALTGSTILPLINGLFDVNLSDVSTRVLQLVEQQSQEISKVVDKHAQTDHKTIADVSLERIERNLTTVVVALEVLTNICAGLEDEEDVKAEAEVEDVDGEKGLAVEEDEDEEMGDGVDDDEALIAMGREPSLFVSDAPAPSINIGATLSHLLTQLLLPQRLTALAQPTPLSFSPATSVPSPHPPTTSVLSVLHLHALEALNNLLLTTAAALPADRSESQLSGMVPVQGVWDGMFAIVQVIGAEAEALQVKGQEMRLEVLEMALGCVWGTVRIAPAEISVQQQHIQILTDAIPILRSETSKTRCIETLSLFASRPAVTIDENRAISQWVMQRLGEQPSAEMMVALLNAVIDIYADETRSYDVVFVEGGYLQALSGVVAKVRADVKKIDKRNDRQLRVRGEEVYENLVAFIKYRRSLRQ